MTGGKLMKFFSIMIGILCFTVAFSAQLSGYFFYEKGDYVFIEQESARIFQRESDSFTIIHNPVFDHPHLKQLYLENAPFDGCPVFIPIDYRSAETEILSYTKEQLEENTSFQIISKDNNGFFKHDFFAFSDESGWWAESVNWYWFILCDMINERVYFDPSIDHEQTETGFSYRYGYNWETETFKTQAVFTKCEGDDYLAEMIIEGNSFKGKAAFFQNHDAPLFKDAIYSPTHRIDISVYEEPYFLSLGVLKIEDFGETFFTFSQFPIKLYVDYLNNDSMEEVVLVYAGGMRMWRDLVVVEKINGKWTSVDYPYLSDIVKGPYYGNDSVTVTDGHIIWEMKTEPSNEAEDIYITRMVYEYLGNGKWEYTITKHF